ncbi:hypothetical protein [Lunatibacter salilacus]|nr:hypothetical protein [Lunatibacter salilacus]
MKQITLNIADSMFEAFLEFIKTPNYANVEDIEENAVGELQSSL